MAHGAMCTGASWRNCSASWWTAMAQVSQWKPYLTAPLTLRRTTRDVRHLCSISFSSFQFCHRSCSPGSIAKLWTDRESSCPNELIYLTLDMFSIINSRTSLHRLLYIIEHLNGQHYFLYSQQFLTLYWPFLPW